MQHHTLIQADEIMPCIHVSEIVVIVSLQFAGS